MSFFKKLFGSEDKKESENSTNDKGGLEVYKKVPWMTDRRLKNVSICLEAGFKPASSLPTEFDRVLRPTIEIAARLNAIKALVLWLMVPQEHLPDERILNFVEGNNLKDAMTEEEKAILRACWEIL